MNMAGGSFEGMNVSSVILSVSKRITYLLSDPLLALFLSWCVSDGLIPVSYISQIPILSGFWLSLTKERPQQNNRGRKNLDIPIVLSDFVNMAAEFSLFGDFTLTRKPIPLQSQFLNPGYTISSVGHSSHLWPLPGDLYLTSLTGPFSSITIFVTSFS